jgi:hypothetical protein
LIGCGGVAAANDSTGVLQRARQSELFVFRRTLSLRHRLPQHKFNLRIHTAQIVRRPFLDFFPQIRRNPEQKGFALF